MATTLASLFRQLRAHEIQMFSDGEEALLYRFTHHGQILNVELHVEEEGRYVRFLFPWFLNLNTARNRNGFVFKLLELNRVYKCLKFGCDLIDGEVSVSIEIPVGDGILAEDQVIRCMYLLTHVAVQERDRLRTLQHTGVYPGSDDPLFTRTLQDLLSDTNPDSDTTDEETMGLNKDGPSQPSWTETDCSDADE